MCSEVNPAVRARSPLSMRIGVPDDGNAPAGTTQRIASGQLAEGFGPGCNGPVQVVVELPPSGDLASVRRVHDALSADPGVAAVTARCSTPPVTPPC